jgi:hypothetical protein
MMPRWTVIEIISDSTVDIVQTNSIRQSRFFLRILSNLTWCTPRVAFPPKGQTGCHLVPYNIDYHTKTFSFWPQSHSSSLDILNLRCVSCIEDPIIKSLCDLRLYHLTPKQIFKEICCLLHVFCFYFDPIKCVWHPYLPYCSGL